MMIYRCKTLSTCVGINTNTLKHTITNTSTNTNIMKMKDDFSLHNNA